MSDEVEDVRDDAGPGDAAGLPSDGLDGEPDRDDDPDEADIDLADAPGVSDPIGTARRRHGTAGAVLAAGLFGVDVALGRKPREDIPVVVASSSQPTDIDTDGIRLDVDEQTSVVSPALPRHDPPPRRGRRSRRARRAD